MKFGRKSGALVLVFALAGCALPPDGVTKQNIADYEVAVASIGCEMVSESDYLPVELQAGLTRQQTLDVTAYHIAAGTAEKLPNGGVKLLTGACA